MVYQLPVYVCLVVGWVLGKYIGCEGLTNNTRLFGVLYVFTSIISEFREVYSLCADHDVRSRKILAPEIDNL